MLRTNINFTDRKIRKQDKEELVSANRKIQKVMDDQPLVGRPVEPKQILILKFLQSKIRSKFYCWKVDRVLANQPLSSTASHSIFQHSLYLDI